MTVYGRGREASLARMVRKGFSRNVNFQLSQNDVKTPGTQNLREKCSRERDEQVQILTRYFSILIFPLNIGQVFDLILYDLFGHCKFLF